ncbi:MAG: flagellar export chaperone FlgN [Lachnospiraceae bacterium]|nr:flagellar export chaperone FlgN [Lachnospiraceae bacterium]
MENSLNILAESLDMKIEVLKEIQAYNDKQEKAFSEEHPDMDSFDEAIEEKGRLIEKLEKLDEGFETLYAEVSEQLNKDRSKYAVQIRQLQDKITIITELSTSIQAKEARNKKLIEDYFSYQRKDIKKNRVNSKAAYGYYKNMSGIATAEPQYMDSKK